MGSVTPITAITAITGILKFLRQKIFQLTLTTSVKNAIQESLEGLLSVLSLLFSHQTTGAERPLAVEPLTQS